MTDTLSRASITDTTGTSFGQLPGAPASSEPVPFDIYRNIHKGIRLDLFTLTLQAGSTDPGDRCAREALAEHAVTLADLLESHARHEDHFIQPLVEAHVPDLAAMVEVEHAVLEERIATIVEHAQRAADAPAAEQRGRVHGVYVDLAAFVSAYLAHQDLEERRIMPAVAQFVGPDELLALDQEIVASIPPDQVAHAMALMLPAMNVDDRTELLGGMQAGAPPEVFAGMWALAGSVLAPADHAQLGARLGVA
jgi:hypothetical protein